MLYWTENIKYLRARVGYSQQRLADDLGITRTRYSKYEYGLAEPPIEILVKLSSYFGVSLDELAKVDLRSRRGIAP
ncbi:helix-turn-helix transcriptional regulator [Sphingobacterium olei]|uniref:Helix-turn-helix transcriptional regulator n=1 Tax=Sphingobacterium olei TaxID=2571155 RepID=A0A4V5MK45_9SPHI|nr:helix-turn-helix transcriptional regulator [Sphingobacterium olei]